MQRLVHDIFERKALRQQNRQDKITIEVSYLEVRTELDGQSEPHCALGV